MLLPICFDREGKILVYTGIAGGHQVRGRLANDGAGAVHHHGIDTVTDIGGGIPDNQVGTRHFTGSVHSELGGKDPGTGIGITETP